MAFIIPTDSAGSRVDCSDKVIKAQDFWAHRKSRQAIADAMAQRDAILQSAQAAFDAERKRGYKEGWDAARVEQSAHMIDIISQTVDYFSKVEVQMVDLVMDAVRRIANDFDDRDKVLKVVRNSLSLVRNQKFITVKVHPSQCMVIEESIKGLLDSYPAIEHIDVASDSSLTEDACIIESDIGRIEASMTGQIEALRSTFKKVFGASSNPCGIGVADTDSEFHREVGKVIEASDSVPQCAHSHLL
jgi:type III secretion protein L